MRGARAILMVMATKKAMATKGNNTVNGDSKEGGEQVTAATMVMGRVMAQRTWLLTQRLSADGANRRH